MGRPGAPHPPPSRWHTGASASCLLCKLSLSSLYLPHQILMIQVSDKLQRLSRLGSAWHGSEAEVVKMRWGQDGDFWTSGQGAHPSEVLQASLGASRVFWRTGLAGRWQDHQAPGSKRRQVSSGKLARLKSTKGEIDKKWLFWAPSPLPRCRKQPQASG